jgi:hypothetical protein
MGMMGRVERMGRVAKVHREAIPILLLRVENEKWFFPHKTPLNNDDTDSACGGGR